MVRRRHGIAIMGLMVAMLLLGATETRSQTRSEPRQGAAGAGREIDPRLVDRLKRVMVPLLSNMNHPLSLSKVRVGIMDDPHINAANAGGGEFYVTTGLLERANDDHLRAVLAHEMAHADLGHVVKLKRLSTGLGIGIILLDQIFPGARGIAPIAGQLVASAYTRKEEYEADAHGVEILRRAGYPGKNLMADTLTWLLKTEGSGQGGFFATHPATQERIQAVKNLPEGRAVGKR